MSRKGGKILELNGAKAEISANNILISGALGKIDIPFSPEFTTVKLEGNGVKVDRVDNEKRAKTLHGTIASHVINAIEGVTKGFKKNIKIVGVGYKASVQGNKLTLLIGFSHPIVFDIPAGIKVVCPEPTKIEISGFNKAEVGRLTANIRAIRPPEPYKGKGIFVDGETITRKVGKTAESASGGAGGGKK